MKRINPDTGKPFEIGDPRPKSDIQDGKVFGGYYTSLYKDSSSSRALVMHQFLMFAAEVE